MTIGHERTTAPLKIPPTPNERTNDGTIAPPQNPSDSERTNGRLTCSSPSAPPTRPQRTNEPLLLVVGRFEVLMMGGWMTSDDDEGMVKGKR